MTHAQRTVNSAFLEFVKRGGRDVKSMKLRGVYDGPVNVSVTTDTEEGGREQHWEITINPNGSYDFTVIPVALGVSSKRPQTLKAFDEVVKEWDR